MVELVREGDGGRVILKIGVLDPFLRELETVDVVRPTAVLERVGAFVYLVELADEVCLDVGACGSVR